MHKMGLCGHLTQICTKKHIIIYYWTLPIKAQSQKDSCIPQVCPSDTPPTQPPHHVIKRENSFHRDFTWFQNTLRSTIKRRAFTLFYWQSCAAPTWICPLGLCSAEVLLYMYMFKQWNRLWDWKTVNFCSITHSSWASRSPHTSFKREKT